VHPERVSDPKARKAIAALAHGYADGGDFFVERLSEGIGTIAAASPPRWLTSYGSPGSGSCVG